MDSLIKEFKTALAIALTNGVEGGSELPHGFHLKGSVFASLYSSLIDEIEESKMAKIMGEFVFILSRAFEIDYAYKFLCIATKNEFANLLEFFLESEEFVFSAKTGRNHLAKNSNEIFQANSDTIRVMLNKAGFYNL